MRKIRREVTRQVVGYVKSPNRLTAELAIWLGKSRMARVSWMIFARRPKPTLYKWMLKFDAPESNNNRTSVF
jgi:hypothetical protein